MLAALANATAVHVLVLVAEPHVVMTRKFARVTVVLSSKPRVIGAETSSSRLPKTCPKGALTT
jgi:hypothetical protein